MYRWFCDRIHIIGQKRIGRFDGRFSILGYYALSCITFNHSCCHGFEKEMYCTKMVSKKVVAMVSVGLYPMPPSSLPTD